MNREIVKLNGNKFTFLILKLTLIDIFFFYMENYVNNVFPHFAITILV